MAHRVSTAGNQSSSLDECIDQLPDGNVSSSLRLRRNPLCHLVRLVWAFTESDFATFVIPNTAFGILGALATNSTSLSDDHAAASVFEVLQRLPRVVAYNWVNVLIFDLANQRAPESVAEDLVNKPWRPIPAGHITGEATRQAMLVAIPLALWLNQRLGVWEQGAIIHIITWLYNDLRGMDDAFVREILISVGYAMFNSGSLQIAVDSGRGDGLGLSGINTRGRVWISIVSGVILTTMQVQDLKDQAGDRLRGRKTVVLFLGEYTSRGSIAFFVCLWSCVCASFWGLPYWGYAVTLMPGSIVAWSVLLRRNQEEDRRTWRLWCLWLICLYSLPVIGAHL